VATPELAVAGLAGNFRPFGLAKPPPVRLVY